MIAGSVNRASPADALTVAVPESEPDPGFASIVMVTGADELVIQSPASTTSTATGGPVVSKGDDVIVMSMQASAGGLTTRRMHRLPATVVRRSLDAATKLRLFPGGPLKSLDCLVTGTGQTRFDDAHAGAEVTVRVTVAEAPGAASERLRMRAVFDETVTVAPETDVVPLTIVMPVGAARSEEPSCCWPDRFVYLAWMVLVWPAGIVAGVAGNDAGEDSTTLNGLTAACADGTTATNSANGMTMARNRLVRVRTSIGGNLLTRGSMSAHDADPCAAGSPAARESGRSCQVTTGRRRE